MSEKSNTAVENFKNGYNCAQSVFLAFCAEYGLDAAASARLVNALGGGMCKTGNMCGALSAGLLAMSAKQGKSRPEEVDRQLKTYTLGREAVDAFRREFGATDCPTLLGYDISVPEELEKAVAADAFQKTCRKFIERSVALAEDASTK